MHDDIFDDAGVRRAFETSLDVRARPFGSDSAKPRWCFDRSRYGLRQTELCPLGFYAAVCHDELQATDLKSFIGNAPRTSVSSVHININPLDLRAEEIAQHALTCGYRVVPRSTHILAIGTSIDAMRRDYHATKRYEALRVVETQSTIVIASELAQLEDFFATYAASLARWGRSEFVYPRALFGSLLQCGSVKIWMNYVGGRLACAMVVFYCSHYAFYWQGVSNIDADQKPAYPVVKLMDAVLEDLTQSEIPYLNMGASEGLPNIKLFKEGFGARSVAYPSLMYESRMWRGLAQVRRRLRDLRA